MKKSSFMKNLMLLCSIIIFAMASAQHSVWAFGSKPKNINLSGDTKSLIESNQVASGTLNAPVNLKADMIELDNSYKKFLEKNPALNQAFAELSKNTQDEGKAIADLKSWNPADKVLNDYKDFFVSIWSGEYNSVHKLYTTLKKEKKYIRLRMELILFLVNSDLKKIKFDGAEQFISKESRDIIKKLKGSTEGEEFETAYLKWLQKNKFFSEICSSEKMRWISESSIDYIELTAATESCPVDFDQFVIRLRRLIFAAKEYQALREIELFAAQNKLQNWEKAYLQAIYDSNIGDPVTAYKSLVPYEKELFNSDYKDNYFYIAQRAGELEKAESIISEILLKTKTAKEHDEMKFQQGFLFYQVKKYKQAYAIFNGLYKSHPFWKKKKHRSTPKDFDQLAWLRGWTLYLDGQYEKALATFEETVPYVIDEARLAYWVSDIREKLGDESTAFTGFKKLASPIAAQKSFTYYNFLAWLRVEQIKKEYEKNDVLKGLALMAKQNKGQYPVASDNLTYAQIMDSYSFYAKDEFETDEGDIQVVNTENEILQNTELTGIEVATSQELNDQINWAKFLINHGQPDLARWHLYEIEKKINTQKKAEDLAKFYISQSFYYRALSLMNKFSKVADKNLSLRADPVAWASLYPEAYKDKVMKFSSLRKIDPYLILSIMRAETQYKSDAISPVGAVGLMQFMPYSAQKIADLTNQQIETGQLFAPEKSIEFGASYLKKLSVEMNDQRPLIAASYNGGPHRVKAWLRNFGNLEFDKFIEHIPFAETRTYVKRVLTYGATYDKLYNKNLSSEKYSYLLNSITVNLKEPISLKEEWEPFRQALK